MLLKDVSEFFDAHIAPLEGWLNGDAVFVTAHLLAEQGRLGVSGDVLEIGVYWGKYLAALYQLTAGSGSRVFGIDINFPTPPVNTVAERVVKKVSGETDRLVLIAGDSTKLGVADLPKEVRYVSVDGSHEAWAVNEDLRLAERLARPGAIVALDDAFNAATPGVPEGCWRYLSDSPLLVPFAHGYNKLFLTTPDFHGEYLESVRRFVEDNQWLAACVRSKKFLDRHVRLGWPFPSFFGHKMLPLR
jgi:predicted O-methyltransferase YrrM